MYSTIGIIAVQVVRYTGRSAWQDDVRVTEAIPIVVRENGLEFLIDLPIAIVVYACLLYTSDAADE